MKKKYCIFCGAKLIDLGIFCIECGKKQSVRGNNNKIKSLIKEFTDKIKDVNDYLSCVYQTGHIPEKKLNNALSNIAPGIKRDDIVLLCDNTVLGSGKKGLVFTKNMLYWYGSKKNKGMIEYSKIKNVSLQENKLRINSEDIIWLVKNNNTIRDLLELIVKEINLKNPDRKDEVKSVVENIKEKKEIEGLIKALKYNDRNIQISAVKALGEIRNERAVESLIQALKDQNISHFVIVALKMIGKPAIEPLIKALKHENLGIRWGATITLGKLGKPAVEPLIQTLNDENTLLRRGAANALGEIGDAKAIIPLNQILNDKDLLVRVYAQEGIDKIKAKKN